MTDVDPIPTTGGLELSSSWSGKWYEVEEVDEVRGGKRR